MGIEKLIGMVSGDTNVTRGILSGDTNVTRGIVSGDTNVIILTTNNELADVILLPRRLVSRPVLKC